MTPSWSISFPRRKIGKDSKVVFDICDLLSKFQFVIINLLEKAGVDSWVLSLLQSFCGFCIWKLD